jgi:hypothetical protein
MGTLPIHVGCNMAQACVGRFLYEYFLNYAYRPGVRYGCTQELLHTAQHMHFVGGRTRIHRACRWHLSICSLQSSTMFIVRHTYMFLYLIGQHLLSSAAFVYPNALWPCLFLSAHAQSIVAPWLVTIFQFFHYTLQPWCRQLVIGLSPPPSIAALYKIRPRHNPWHVDIYKHAVSGKRLTLFQHALSPACNSPVTLFWHTRPTTYSFNSFLHTTHYTSWKHSCSKHPFAPRGSTTITGSTATSLRCTSRLRTL